MFHGTFLSRPWAIGGALSVALSATAATLPARAAVIQVVTTEFASGSEPVNPSAFAQDEIFGATSADIDRNILASIGGTGPSNPGYSAVASAGTFGQVGMMLQMSGVPSGSILRAEVFIGSDEFINLGSTTRDVEANFIVDGGFINDLFSAGIAVDFRLQVGAQNLGTAAPETNPGVFESDARLAAAFGSADGFFLGYDGGGYLASFDADSFADVSLTDSFTGGVDLDAELDGPRSVDIPFSLQTVELGSLGPGERMLIGYRAAFQFTLDGFTEGLLAGFSDPLTLSGTPLLTSIEFADTQVTPPTSAVPAPAGLPLLAGGLLLLAGVRRRR